MTGSDEDLCRFAGCFEANGDPKDPRVLRWQYQENPVQRVYVDLALDTSPSSQGSSQEDKVAAIYATFPVEMQIGAHRVVGVQSLDTLTDSAYRGRGLFTTLAASVYERCRESGVALVYGFPNA